MAVLDGGEVRGVGSVFISLFFCFSFSCLLVVVICCSTLNGGRKSWFFFGIVVRCGALKRGLNGRSFNSVGVWIVWKTGGNGGETSGKVAELFEDFFSCLR